MASVERITEGGNIRMPMVLSSLVGTRDGYETLAEMTFVETGSPRKLLIRFTLEPGVPMKFAGGDFVWGTQTGEVTCSSIDFFGGQGGVPSIRGTFAFTTTDGSGYRVYLPTTEMAVKK